MNDIQHNHDIQGEPDSNSIEHTHRPYWKRAHHDWRFWAVLLLMITAMVIYVVSEDFAWLPRSRQQHPRQTPAENSGAQ